MQRCVVVARGRIEPPMHADVVLRENPERPDRKLVARFSTLNGVFKTRIGEYARKL
jgi:hypothetical protein